MPRMAVIGAGQAGGLWIESLSRMPGIEWAGIVDAGLAPDARDRLRSMAPSFASIEASAERATPDAALICAPIARRKELAIRAAESGMHVWCEAPLGYSEADAREVIEACRNAGVRLTVENPLRCDSGYRKAREMATSGKIGQPGTARMLRRVDWTGDSAESRDDAMLGALVRDIDWLIWTFGGVRRVYAKRRRSRNAEIDPSDVCYVSIRMRSGVISHLTESLTPMRDESNFLEVAGRQGVLHLEEDESAKPFRSWIHGGSAGGRPDYSSASPLHSDARQECIRQFIHRMENDRASLENEDAGQQAMRVAFAALESIRTGQAIAFADEAESGEERTG